MIFAEKNSLVVLAMKGQIGYNIRKGKTIFAEIHERRKQRRMNLLFFLTLKSELVVAREDTNLEKALAQLKDVPYSTIPVIDRKGAYVGTISEGDILWAMQEDPDINFTTSDSSKTTAKFPTVYVNKLSSPEQGQDLEGTEIHAILASKLNEVIFLPQNGCEGGQLSISCAQEIADNLSGYDAILAGPGLGRGAGEG